MFREFTAILPYKIFVSMKDVCMRYNRFVVIKPLNLYVSSYTIDAKDAKGIFNLRCGKYDLKERDKHTNNNTCHHAKVSDSSLFNIKKKHHINTRL